MEETRGGLRPIALGLIALFVLVLALLLAGPLPTAAAATPRITITGVSVSPGSVSRLVAPNAATVRFRLSRAGKVTVKIYTSGGSFVRTLMSNKSLTAGARSARWDLKRSTGAWAADGTYTIKISVIDSAHRAGTPNPAKAYVYVDNTKPIATVSAVTPPTFSPSIGETATIAFSLSDASRNLPLAATLEVRSPGNALVYSATVASLAQGSGRTIAWNGLKGLIAAAPGAYTARIVARDAAGNLGYSPSKPLYLNGYGAPRATVDKSFISGSVVVRADTGPDGLTHVVWNEDTGMGKVKRIWYRRLDASGNTVVSPVIVDEDLHLTNPVPDVSADASGAAYVVWRGEGPTINEHSIRIARISPDGTLAWSTPIANEDYPYGLQGPRVSVGPDGTAHVVYACTGPRSTINYTAIRRSGSPVLSTPALSQMQGTALMRWPNVEVDSAGRVHVLWFQATPAGSTSAKKQLFYSRLVPRGAGALGAYEVDIDRRMLTNTSIAPSGYGPAGDWAPEMAENGGATRIYAVWSDDVSGAESKGIRLMRLPSSSTEALVTSRRIYDSSTANTSRPALNAITPAIVCNGSAQTVVFRGTPASGGAYPRLWQMEVTDTTVGKPFVVTAGKKLDVMPSLSAGPDGHARLVYAGDTGVPWPGSSTSVSARVFYKDLTVEPKANDRSRHDLEVDRAHASFSSTPATPRWNSPVVVTAEVRNAGWSPSPGGTAVLEYEGVVVDTVAFGPLSVEGTTQVHLDWTVPDEATRTPAPLAVRVTPAGETTQTSDGNDRVPVSVYFLLPPETANLYVGVSDETFAEELWTAPPVDDATVVLMGETVGGAPYSATLHTIAGVARFTDVPLGRYEIGTVKGGFVPSPPASQPITLLADPADPYRVVATPGFWMSLMLNRWGGIDGFVHEDGGTTPIGGAIVTRYSEEGSVASSTTASTGTFEMVKVPEGTYTLKITKPWFVRTTRTVTITPGAPMPLDISLEPTTTGYLVGSILDEGGYPALNDPNDPGDDARMIVRTTTGTVVADVRPPDGAFNIALPAGSYRLEFSGPGFVTQTNIAVTIVGGVETDGSAELKYDMSEIKHAGSGEHWCVSWTAHGNWFGDQPPSSPFENWDVKAWWGMYRFKFDGQYQKVGLVTSLKSIDVWMSGEYWNAAGDTVPDPPSSPHTFHSADRLDWPNPLSGGTTWYDIPPVSDRSSRDLAAVRVDQVDVIDGRDWSVVSSIKQQWNSVAEPDGHRYGRLGSYTVDPLPLPGYSHTVPWNDQIVRLWLTVGREESGHFTNASWHSFGLGDMGSLFQASGYDRQVLCWDVSSGEVWVDPALVGYPTIP